jgi:hypothetical protein
MKKLVVPISAATLALSLMQGAGAAVGPQKVKGSIALPAPFPTEGGCFSGLHRRLVLATGPASAAVNGIVGYHFGVSKKTWGEPFVLKLTGGQSVDLDLIYYPNFGSLDDPAGAPPTASFEKRKEGGEKGVVPAGFKHAIVCMATGVGASFAYTAQT